ncbi:MAG: ribonuclease HII [Alphaproteobacteria bacterium]|nr:ribonuclease HII [Alphaproteobacteria bacterium]
MDGPDFSLEDGARGEGFATIAGIDETGRGPGAGPGGAAAVLLDRATMTDELLVGLNDSKKLSAKKRETLFAALPECARIGVGLASVDEIDDTNILAATMTAMARALDDLGASPDLALIDGNRVPKLACPARCEVKGDGRSLSIAAASIIAKVTRDRIMAELSIECPGYGWERNAGYGTKAHREGLERLGVTPHHRKSFAPIHKILSRRLL